MAIEGIKKTKDARIEDLDVARFAVASLILFFFLLIRFVIQIQQA